MGAWNNCTCIINLWNNKNNNVKYGEWAINMVRKCIELRDINLLNFECGRHKVLCAFGYFNRYFRIDGFSINSIEGVIKLK